MKKFKHKQKKQLFPKEYFRKVQENEASRQRLDKIKQQTINFYVSRFAKKPEPVVYESKVEAEIDEDA